jgi:hypothetical protein
MRRASGAILGILLASVAVPAFAADMPVKAAPPPPPPPDWSGVYSGIAAGGAWGRQNLNTPVTPLNNLFGTSADRIFNGSPVLVSLTSTWALRDRRLQPSQVERFHRRRLRGRTEAMG